VSKTICHPAAGLVAAFFLAAATAPGADTPAKFLGANSCASTGCHGGGGQNQNQFLVWSLKDFHSQRPAATLTTARAKQIADALDIKDATADTRCTSCHAPLHEVPEDQRGENFKVSEGVSCESCHGPAEEWLRAHTRHDYTRADRTAAGMPDLQDIYVRANTCVACHQVVSEPLLKAGHPELIFELDGQSVAEPKHWTAEKNGNSAQVWFIGQAVALREMSWQLSNEKSPTESEINRWRGLVWLVESAGKIDSSLPAPPDITFRPDTENFQSVQKWGNDLAVAATKIPWTKKLSQTSLAALANTSVDFSAAVPQPVNARRAERLVLALDRLVAALPDLKNNEPVQSALNQLFRLAQSIPDFDPKQFADALQKFSAALANPP
jgi:Cytochrome c554 and c-prime